MKIGKMRELDFAGILESIIARLADCNTNTYSNLTYCPRFILKYSLITIKNNNLKYEKTNPAKARLHKRYLLQVWK
jgi:hypothetical protein